MLNFSKPNSIKGNKAMGAAYNTTKPVSKAFNAAIFHLADKMNPQGFRVVPNEQAPDSLRTLQAYYANHGLIAVSDINSENTIYADNECNYAFRAWHDAIHLVNELEMTTEGEKACCRIQQAQIKELYGETAQSNYWCRLLWAEIVGQGAHYEKHGDFPSDQRGFVLAYMNSPEEALSKNWGL